MKTVFAALAGALGTTLACWRLILLLWLVNVAAGWIIAAPLADGIDRAFMHSPTAADLITSFDNEAYVDFLSSEAEAVSASAEVARTAALPWLLLWTVLTAGVWSRVADRKNHAGFLAGCGRYGHRFVWLAAITIVGLWGLSFVNGWLTGWTTGWIMDDAHDSGAGTVGWLMTTKTLVMLALMGLVVSAGRFARLRMIHLGERLAPKSWLAAFFGVLRHLPSIGLGRVLSLWPLVIVALFYSVASSALLADDALLPGMRMSWRLLIVFQVTQMLLQATFVYRMAVDARLWPIVAPSRPDLAPVAAMPPTAPSAPVDEPDVDVTADDGTPDEVEVGHEDEGDDAAGDKPKTAWSEGGMTDLEHDDQGTEDEQPASAGRRAASTSWMLLAVLSGGPLLAQDEPATETEPPAATAPSQQQQQQQQQPAEAAADTLSVRRNRYVMDVTLDILDHTATVQQTATFINTTSSPVTELWLHLYPAAFSHSKTVWMDAGSAEAVTERGAEDGGYIDVRSVALGGGGDLADRTTLDESLMKVDLEQPVAPGARVSLAIEFVTRFPRVIARMGMTGNHVNGMQWYPKFAVHDETGWSNDPYYRVGEFFSDFGSYEVTFRYPAMIDDQAVELEATGVPTPARPAGDQMVKTYTADDVHDFAFTADPAFRRHVDEWTDTATGRKVEIVYLCQPYAEPKAQYVLDVVKSCLTASARWWMPYPYPRLVIDGQPSNRGGGMEYPMLFTISHRSPLHLAWLNELDANPAGVTAHEFAHQYWYGIMASDEVDEAWLDEGLTTWSTAKLLDEHFGETEAADALTFLDRVMLRDALDGAHGGRLPWLGDVLSLQNVIGWTSSPFHDSPDSPGKPTLLGFNPPSVSSMRRPGIHVDRMAWNKLRYAGQATARPLSASSREFSRAAYGALVYNKTALVLETLSRHVGQEGMEQLMRTYVERYRFQHPTRDDFLGLINDVTGGTHEGLMAQLTGTTATVDWTVENVSCRRDGSLAGYGPQARPGDPIGWIDPPASADKQGPGFLESLWSTVFSSPLPGAPAATDPADEAPASANEAWVTRYTVRQLGQLEAPVVVEARFDDGSVEREVWDGVAGHRQFEHRTPSRLKEVVVDPERLFAIDLDVNNNGHTIQPAIETTRTLGALTHFWAQNHLNGWSLVF